MRFHTLLLLPALCWQLNPAMSEEARNFAKVEVLRLAQRSADDPSSSYQVDVHGAEHKLRLSLRSPTHSIFTPSFQYLEASANPATGEQQFNFATPTKSELAAIEKNFFTGEDVAVSMKRGKDGQSYQMNGRINDMSIVHRENDLHEIVQQATKEAGFVDYIDLKRNIATRVNKQSGTTSATPEIFVIWDYENSRQFGFDRNKILDYIGVFFHAINNRYATASNPKITFKISGVLVIRSTSSQAYIENNRVSGGGADINKVLEDFAKWAYANSNQTPKYDLAALISGEDMKMKDSNGQWSSGVAGLAYLNGACWNSTYYRQYIGTSVSEDIGAYYNGVFTVAHEFAHNLGSPHDGDGDASDCPWSDGYIMSYEGWGTKSKFYFSPCSLRLMKNLVDSDSGACTRRQDQNGGVPVSNDNVGDRMGMKEQCVKATKSQDAVPDPDTSADDLCKNLKCRYPYEGRPGWYRISTLNFPPGDYAPCGNGGKCIDGDCVGQR